MNFVKQLQLLTEKGYAAATVHKERQSEKIFRQQLSVLNNLQNMLLQNPAKAKPQHTKIVNMQEVLIVAYYLSEYEHEGLFPNIGLSQQAALTTVADILNIKITTLRHTRDFFDSHTNSHRQGWKKPLTDKQLEIFNIMRVLPKEQALKKARDVLFAQAKKNSMYPNK